MKIYDQRNDRSAAALVKCAAALSDRSTSEGVMNIAKCARSADTSSFAWEGAGLFPTGSPEDTVLSRVYFDGQREKIAEDIASSIDDRLSVYERLYGIDLDFSRRKMSKTANAEVAYELLPGYYAAGRGGLLKAASEFSEKKYGLAPVDRHTFAAAMVKAAEECGCSDAVTDDIAGYLGTETCSHKTLDELLTLRRLAAERAGLDGSAYDDLVKALSGADVEHSTKQEKVAMVESIYMTDMVVGIDSPKTDRMLPDAWHTVFNTKTAESASSDADSTEKKTPENMTKADIVGRYGDDALEEIENSDGSINMERLNNVMRIAGGSH